MVGLEGGVASVEAAARELRAFRDAD